MRLEPRNVKGRAQAGISGSWARGLGASDACRASLLCQASKRAASEATSGEAAARRRQCPRQRERSKEITAGKHDAWWWKTWWWILASSSRHPWKGAVPAGVPPPPGTLLVDSWCRRGAPDRNTAITAGCCRHADTTTTLAAGIREVVEDLGMKGKESASWKTKWQRDSAERLPALQ